MSVAAFKSPCSFLMFDSIRVTRARSTSTNIYLDVSFGVQQSKPDKYTYLAFGDCPQCLNDGQLAVYIRRIVEEADHDLYHLGDCLFQLTMLL